MLPETVEALYSLGITRPFPIQSATIPVALSGSDVIGQAKTGTGKTLAFGIPVLQRVTGLRADSPADSADEAAAADQAPAAGPAPKAGRGRSRGRGRSSGPANALAPAHGAPEALVVVPTRELAVQVAGDLAAAGKVRAVRVHALYGGRAYEPQVEALRAGIDVAVGTPGRLLDLCQQKHLDLSRVRILVLDEADEMLDLGFLPDVERIIDQLPAQRQTMLFSATMPSQVVALARRYMTKPTNIRAADPDDHGTQVRNISQFVYRAHSMDKIELLSRVLQADGRGLAMVFARTKRTVAKVAEELAARHFAVAAVHGDLGQGAREQALRAFRNGKVDVLVATDVAARGIDVEGVTHVVNFQCPEDEKVYTHRIGRTGRAGNKGTAVTLVDWDEVPKWNLINKSLDLAFPDPPETYSTSPQLYADLGIASGSKGVLPKLERTRAGLAAEEVEDLGETGRSRSPRATAPRAAERSVAAPAERAAEQSPADAPRAERTPRQRTRNRTRGGVNLPGGAPGQPGADESVVPDAAVAETPAAQPRVVQSQVAPDAAASGEPTRSRRARSRSAKPAAAATSGAPSAARTAEPGASDAAKADPYKLAPGSLAPGTLSESLFESAAPAKAPAADNSVASSRRTRVTEPVARPARAALNDPFKLSPGSLSDPRFTTAAPVAPTTPTVPAAPAEPAAAAEAPAERKRSRSRKQAEPTPAPAADETAGEAVVTAPVSVAPDLDLDVDATSAAPARKRSRTRKTAEAAPEPVTAEPTAAEVVAQVAEATESAPAARKRTRARKGAETAPESVDVVIPAQSTADQLADDLTAPAKAPRRRTAKKAVAAEENAARVSASVPGAEQSGEPAPAGDDSEAHGGAVANPRRTRV